MPRRLTSTGEGRLHGAALIAGLLLAGAILVAFARRQYFFGDDWDYLVNRGTGNIDFGLFTPHNEHWSTLPILLFRGLFSVFGLDHYLPYALPVILVHLLLSALLYVVLVRLGSTRGPALAAALVLAFFGGGAENTLWDFQIGFIAPVALALLAIWSWHRWPASLLGNIATIGLLVLGLMWSGNGISAVILVAGFAAISTGIRSALAVAVVPAGVYLTWYAAIGHTVPMLGVTDRWDYALVPQYAWTGLTSALEQVSGIDGSGPVLLLALVAVPFVVRDVTPGVRALAIAGVVTAFVQYLLQGTTRISLGVEQATAARYAYLTLALFAPSLAIAFGWLARRLRGPRWAAALLVAVLAGMYAVNGINAQHDFVESRRALSPDLHRLLRGIQAVTVGDDPVLNDVPFPIYHPNINTRVLDTDVMREAISQDPVSPLTELDGQSLVNVGVRPTPIGLPLATKVDTGPEFVAQGEPVDGCAAYRAKAGTAAIALVSPEEGAEVSVSGPATQMQTELDAGELESVSTTRIVTPGQQLFIGVRVPGATLRVLFDQPGTYTLCYAPDTAPVS